MRPREPRLAHSRRSGRRDSAPLRRGAQTPVVGPGAGGRRGVRHASHAICPPRARFQLCQDFVWAVDDDMSEYAIVWAWTLCAGDRGVCDATLLLTLQSFYRRGL